MIIQFTEKELQNIEIVHIPKRQLPPEYLKEREAAWEKKLSKIEGTKKKVWNGEVYTIESIAQPTLDKVIIYMSECEFKDIVFRVEAGHEYVLEKFGDDYFFQFATADCIPITKDNKFVFGIRSGKTNVQKGSIGLIGGTMNKDEVKIQSLKDIHKTMLHEITEETNIEPQKNALRLYSLNQFNGKYEFLFLLDLQESSGDIESSKHQGEFSQLVSLSVEEVLSHTNSALDAFSYCKNYISAIPKT